MSEVRGVEVEVQSRLTEMGIEVQVRCPTVICTYQFEADEDPDLVLGLIAACPQIVADQVHHLAEQLVES